MAAAGCCWLLLVAAGSCALVVWVLFSASCRFLKKKENGLVAVCAARSSMENWRKQEEGRRRGGGRRRQGGGESEGTKTIVRFGWREETESALVRLQLCGQMAKYKKQNKKTTKGEGTPRTNLLRDGVGGGSVERENQQQQVSGDVLCLSVRERAVGFWRAQLCWKKRARQRRSLARKQGCFGAKPEAVSRLGFPDMSKVLLSATISADGAQICADKPSQTPTQNRKEVILRLGFCSFCFCLCFFGRGVCA